MSKIKSAKSLKKPPPIIAPVLRDAEADEKFEVELLWCVQQLENALHSNKLNQKVAEDTEKNIMTLKSSTAPLIKKRQVMKAALGDYRTKMKDEERKMALVSKQIKFTNTADANKKSSFVKKSSILTSGKGFRFNFNTIETNNAEDAKAEEEHTEKSATFINKDLNLTSGDGFKFNFSVDEVNDKLDFNELKINS